MLKVVHKKKPSAEKESLDAFTERIFANLAANMEKRELKKQKTKKKAS